MTSYTMNSRSSDVAFGNYDYSFMKPIEWLFVSGQGTPLSLGPLDRLRHLDVGNDVPGIGKPVCEGF